jgi:hypothetical protein
VISILACLAAATACAAPATAPAVAASSATPSPDAAEPQAPLVTLDRAGDEFGDPASLDGWALSHGDLIAGAPGTVDVGATTPGVLTVVPGAAAWVDAERGFYLSRRVQGDFMATVRVRATGRGGALPTVDWSLTGLLARAPRPHPNAHENWIGYTVGFVGGPVTEAKTTVNSRSVLVLNTVEPGWIELRMVRAGHAFVLLRRSPGQDWALDGAYLREDLPAELTVGVDAGTGAESTHGDLVSEVDWIRFAPASIPATARDEILSGLARPRPENRLMVSALGNDRIRQGWWRYLTA